MLSHLGIYRVSFRPILDKVVQRDSEDLIQQIRKKGLIESEDILPGLTYYRLTAEGAIQAGIRGDRAEPLTDDLPAAIAVLWFCFMGKRRRVRVDLNDARAASFKREFLAKKSANLPVHCIEPLEDKDRPQQIVYRVYTPGSNVKTPEIRRVTKEFIENACAAGLYQRINLANRNFGLAIVLEGEDRRTALWEHLKGPSTSPAPDKETAAQANLTRQARIVVETWPGIGRLKEALYANKSK